VLKFIKNILFTPSITGEKAVEKVKNDNCKLLDVREPNERKINHIKGSLHIPVGEIKTRLQELEKYRNQEIIVYCASGIRSGMASRTLNSNGFNSFNLKGGINSYYENI
jgi:rhodanese-related sulfurtransferase